MRRAWGVGMFPARVYVGQIIAVFAIVLAAVWGATQRTAAALGYQAALGAAWFNIAGFPVYLPWRLFEWWYAYDAYAPHVFEQAGAIAAGGGVVAASAIEDGRNILIAGGTGSGKTTLVNALLAEIAALDQRVVIIEDTRELQCAAKDVVTLRTKAGLATLADLVRSTLRLRPDRIIVGEVRGAEALDMLKAWNTGHPGGVATVHANSARAALYRLEQLIQEAVVTVPRRLIAEAIDLIVFIKGRGPGRRVEALVEVKGVDSGGDYAFAQPPGLPKPTQPA